MIQYLFLLGALIQLSGLVIYIKETVKGKTMPNRVTWLMWSIAPLIGTAAAFSNGVTWAVTPVFIAGIGPLLVLAASFLNKKAYWQLRSFDYLCGFFSFSALLLWAITKNPVIAIVFAIISDGLAAVPTLLKSWQYPETETAAVYISSFFGVLLGLSAVKQWSFSELAFPVYLILINVLFIIFLFRNRFMKKKAIV